MYYECHHFFGDGLFFLFRVYKGLIGNCLVLAFAIIVNKLYFMYKKLDFINNSDNWRLCCCICFSFFKEIENLRRISIKQRMRNKR